MICIQKNLAGEAGLSSVPFLLRTFSAIGFATLAGACSVPAEPDATAAAATAPLEIEVEVQPLRLQPWQGTISTFGVVEALEEVTVAAELSGTVQAVHVDEGDLVTAGQLLLELDPQKREIALRQAQQEVQRASASLQETRLRLKRREDLANRESVSKEVLDNAQLSVDAASAAYQQAVSARVLAERELADTRIYSPTAATVEVQAAEAGEPVAAGVSLFTLQAIQGLRVHTWVSEADIGNVRAGGTAKVMASGLVGREFSATIEWVGVNADPATGNFPVKLILNGAIDGLRPGMTAHADLTGISVPDTLLLPEGALVDRDRRRVVFVVENGKAHIREPLLGAGFNNRLQVLDGLSPGDQIIVAGHAALLDGSSVRSRN